MSSHILTAVISRILTQLRHDPRTVALMVGVPLMLMTLIYFMFDGRQPVVSKLLLMMLGIFPFFVMFLITSVAMLRERTSGTLERLMTTPLRAPDLLFGYGISFGIAAAVQGAIVTLCAYLIFDMTTAGSAGLVILVAIVGAVLGAGLGLASSALARTEFQAAQLIAVIVLPQVMLCGLFVARENMVGWLRVISDVMPLTYSVQALQEIGTHSAPTGLFWRDLGIVIGAVIAVLALGAATLPRRTT